MVNAYIAKDLYGNSHLWLCKSSAADDEKLAYFKRKVLEALAASTKRDSIVSKALAYVEKATRRVFHDGDINERHGIKYRRIRPGVWVRVYDSEGKGASMSLKIWHKRVAACTDATQLMQLVDKYRARFSDEEGKPYPWVKDLHDFAKQQRYNILTATNAEVEKRHAEAKAKDEARAAKHTQRKPHVDSDVLELCKKNPSDYKYGLKQAKGIIKGKSEGQIKRKIKDWKDDIRSNQIALNAAPGVKTKEHEYNIVVCQAAIDYAREYLAKRQGENGAKNISATKSQIKAFVQDAIDNGSVNKELFLDNITPDAHKRILDKTGIDAKGIILDTSATRHAINKQEHHLEIDDFAKIADIVNRTDNIKVQEKQKRDNTVVLFKEENANGLNLFMEFRPRKGNLALVTAYYQKKPQRTDGENAHQQTSETLRGTDASIPQNGEKSSENTENVPFAEDIPYGDSTPDYSDASILRRHENDSVSRLESIIREIKQDLPQEIRINKEEAEKDERTLRICEKLLAQRKEEARIQALEWEREGIKPFEMDINF